MKTLNIVKKVAKELNLTNIKVEYQPTQDYSRGTIGTSTVLWCDELIRVDFSSNYSDKQEAYEDIKSQIEYKLGI